jgi:glutamyl-tRNA synthetase
MDQDKLEELAKIIFPDLKSKRQEHEEQRVKFLAARNLPSGAEVLRAGPSPTGTMHIGTLYMAAISKKIAKQSGGIFYLRIEDTDKKREVEGAKDFIIDTLNDYNLNPDEIYIQSERKDIYSAFVYDLILKGLAYPCFMTESDLEKMREEQTIMKLRPGVYGRYAKSRDLDTDTIIENIKNKKEYVIRFRSVGDPSKKILINDLFLGEHNLPEDDEDFILLKKDMMPTYHLAHIVDDYLLGTTIVTRGEEWLASLTKHIALWRSFDIVPPLYAHVMPINKRDGNTVRKLSKRKDSEAGMNYYYDMGYPKEAILAYVYRLANPNFDEYWHSGQRDIENYNLNIEEMKRSSRGPLLDMVKLEEFSADIFADMNKKDITEKYLGWSKTYDAEFFNIIKNDIEYLENILNIEREGENKRKDIKKLYDVKKLIGYFYDDVFLKKDLMKEGSDNNQNHKLVCEYVADRFEKDESKIIDMSKDDWILYMKNIFEDLQNLENLKNRKLKFADFMMSLRLAVTAENKTPNLYYVFLVLGYSKVVQRLKA